MKSQPISDSSDFLSSFRLRLVLAAHQWFARSICMSVFAAIRSADGRHAHGTVGLSSIAMGQTPPSVLALAVTVELAGMS